MKHRVYAVPTLAPRVVLVSTSGTRRVYENYWDFIANLSYDVLRSLGTSLAPQRDFYNGWGSDCVTIWVAMLEGDRILNPDEISRDRVRLQKRRSMRRPTGFRMEQRERFKFREGPVPGIGRYHGNRGSTYIHPRTTQERRWSLAAEVDGVKWRGRRNFHYLPNVWDDKLRKIQKNWKEFRKHQWKPCEES